MKTLSAKDPAEKLILEYDYARALGDELLSGSPVVSIAVVFGADASAAAMLSPAAAIDSTGTKVLIPVRNGVAGADYTVKCVCPTTDPNLTLSITARLPVREGA